MVKNEKTFWTNVFSPYVEDDTDKSPVPDDYCPVQKKLTASASSLAALTSLVVAGVVFSLRLN